MQITNIRRTYSFQEQGILTNFRTETKKLDIEQLNALVKQISDFLGNRNIIADIKAEI